MLSGRLKAIVSMVPESETVADIGCDHGKVAVWLLKNGKAKFAVCSDISAPSLEKARKLAASNGFENKVSLRVGNGFDVLQKGEAQTAVIAGMGAELMITILGQGGDKLPGTLVLSCHRDTQVLRKWLSENSYRIEDEELMFENRHYYPVILASRGEARTLTDVELEFGPVLLEKKPVLLKSYVRYKVSQTQAVREKLIKSKSTKRDELLGELDARLRMYAEVEECL